MKRQRRMRTLAVLLAFGLLLSMMPTGAISLPAQAAPQAAGTTAELSPSTFQLDADCRILQYVDEAVFAAGNHVARLKQRETLDTYVFLNADGTQTVYYMDGNVKFLDKDGVVREKDISLNATRAGFTTASNDVGLNLPTDLRTGITLSYGGFDLTMTPENIGAATGRQDGGKVYYDDIYGKGTGLIYTPTLTGLKEDIVLRAYEGVNSFSFLLNTDGLRLYKNEQGRYYFAQSANAEMKWELADIVAYDANARHCLGELTVETIAMGQQYRLTVSISEEFLTAESTAYPVYIDPTIEVSDGMYTGAIEDATVYAGQPNLNTGTWQFNHAGYYDNVYGTGRVVYRLTGLLQDPYYEMIEASQIQSAMFYITEASGSASVPINLFNLASNASWTETNITWATTGAYGSTFVTEQIGYNQTTGFNITEIVKAWKDGTLNGYYGFMMSLVNEIAACKGIIASEYGVAAKRPCVVVTYSDTIVPTIEDGYYLISQDEDAKYLTPNVISYADGTGVDILGRSDTMEMPVNLSQIWKVTYQGNGRYTISAIYKEDLYLIAGADSALRLSANPSGNAHLWTIESESDRYILRSCADTDLVITGTYGSEGLATISSYDPYSEIQGWYIDQTDPQGMMLLDSETGERRDAASYSGTVAMGCGQTATLFDLGLNLYIFDPYNSSKAISCTTTNTSVASFNANGYSISGLGIGYTAVRITRAINGKLREVVFSLRVCKATEVVILYDQGYASRYGETAASDLIASQMDALADFYLAQFGLIVQYTTPAKFQSVADTCGSYGGNCTHTTDIMCADALRLNDLTSCHHKNAARILHNLPTYSGTSVLAFIGHNVCYRDGFGNHFVNGSGTSHLYGIANFDLQAAMVTDHSDGNAAVPTHSIATAVHELGHLFDAPDHYNNGCPSTQNLNDQVDDSDPFSQLCIYGERKEESGVYSNLIICEGCRQRITAYLNNLD